MRMLTEIQNLNPCTDEDPQIETFATTCCQFAKANRNCTPVFSPRAHKNGRLE